MGSTWLSSDVFKSSQVYLRTPRKGSIYRRFAMSGRLRSRNWMCVRLGIAGAGSRRAFLGWDDPGNREILGKRVPSGILMAMENPSDLHGGCIRWENHRTKWRSFHYNVWLPAGTGAIQSDTDHYGWEWDFSIIQLRQLLYLRVVVNHFYTLKNPRNIPVLRNSKPAKKLLWIYSPFYELHQYDITYIYIYTWRITTLFSGTALIAGCSQDSPTVGVNILWKLTNGVKLRRDMSDMCHMSSNLHLWVFNSFHASIWRAVARPKHHP